MAVEGRGATESNREIGEEVQRRLLPAGQAAARMDFPRAVSRSAAS